MKKYTLFFALIAGLIIVSCSSDAKNRSASQFLSAYMKDNKNVVLFGKVDAKAILEKADYKNIPKVSSLLNSEMKEYEAALDLSQGVCFAVEGPFDLQGNPAQVVAFVKVKSADSLASKITSLGQMLQEDGDMKFAQDNDVAIGIKNNVAIFITKKGNYEGKTALNEAFKKTEQDLSEGKVDQILTQKGDILLGVSFQNLYGTSNTSLANLTADKKKELAALANDSYTQSSISFENGQAVFQSKNLFSNALMNRMFFEDDNSASILKKLGTGNARLGVSMNMNIAKMEAYLDDFSPDFKDKLTKVSGELQLLAMTLGDKPLTNLFNGKFGAVMVGDLMRDGSLVPEANIHLGLGNKGKELSEMLKTLFPNSNSVYGMNVKMNDKEITISSGKSTVSKLNIPAFASNFGKKGFTAFVNFNGMDLKSMDLEDGAKAFYAFESVMIEIDNQGSRMVIKAKKSGENILKQVVDVYIEDLKKTIGEIN